MSAPAKRAPCVVETNFFKVSCRSVKQKVSRKSQKNTARKIKVDAQWKGTI